MNKTYRISVLRLYLFLLVAGYLFIFPLFYGVSEVNGLSMYPTYQDSDMLLVKDGNDNVSRGDIVIVKKSGIDKAIVKRVIATGGDVVSFKDSDMFINGVKQFEGYVNTDEVIDYTDIDYEVPSDSYFVLGDNRNNSTDSRYFGSVSREEIAGVVVKNLTNCGIDSLSFKGFNIFMLALFVVFIYKEPYKIELWYSKRRVI